jgi:hypothetical protein
MEGILKEVNNELVLIDSKWYKVLKPEYLPKGTDIKVSFSTLENDPATIKFIKEAGVETGAKKTYTKKTYGSVSKEAAPASATPGPVSTTKVAPEDVRNTSIVRQVIFKGAVELVCAGKFPTIEAAMAAIKSMETYLTGK